MLKPGISNEISSTANMPFLYKGVYGDFEPYLSVT